MAGGVGPDTGVSDATVQTASAPEQSSPTIVALSSNHLGCSNNNSDTKRLSFDVSIAPEDLTLKDRAVVHANGTVGHNMQEQVEVGCGAALQRMLVSWLGRRMWGCNLLSLIGGSWYSLHMQNVVARLNKSQEDQSTRPDVPFDDIINETTEDKKLAQLDINKHSAKIKKRVEQARAECAPYTARLMDSIRGDLEARCFSKADAHYAGKPTQSCGDRYGSLHVPSFKEWYHCYESAVKQVVDGTVEAYRAHHSSGYLINPQTDEPFTSGELEDFEASMEEWRKQVLSLVEGPFRFDFGELEKGQTWSMATDGVLRDDGTPNFKSPHWNPESKPESVENPLASDGPLDEPNPDKQVPTDEQGATDKQVSIGEMLNRSKLCIDERVFTSGLKRREPDVVVLPNIEVTLDGKPHDLLSMLRAAREDLAQKMEGWENPNGRRDMTVRCLEKMIEEIIWSHEHLAGRRRPEDLAENSGPQLTFSDDVRNRLVACVDSEAFQNAKTNADKIRAMPLEYIYDLCTALNSYSFRPDFVRMRQRNRFLPPNVFIQGAIPERPPKLIAGMIFLGPFSLTYNQRRFRRMDADDLSETRNAKSPEKWRRLEEVCAANHAHVALFRRKDRRTRKLVEPPDYQLHIMFEFTESSATNDVDSRAATNVASANELLKAAKELKAALRNDVTASRVTINIVGNLDADRAELEQQGLKLPKGFNLPDDPLEAKRPWHPQWTGGVGDDNKPLTGGTLTTYCSDKRSRSWNRWKAEKSPHFDFKTRFRDRQPRVDIEGSYMSGDFTREHEVYRNFERPITTVDINPWVPGMSLVSKKARLPEKTDNFDRNLGVNGVLKYKLGEEVAKRGFRAFEAAKDRPKPVDDQRKTGVKRNQESNLTIGAEQDRQTVEVSN